MEALLAETVQAAVKLENHLGRRRGKLESVTYVNLFQQLATKWKLLAASMTMPEKKRFFDNNNALFYDIHTTLVGSVISDGHKELVPSLRGPHDKIFGSIGIKHPSRKFYHLPTKVFNAFVKGITYFATEHVTESPVYHREASCGTSSLNIEKKFKRKHGYSLGSAVTNKEHVRLCYIERQIYNQIFEEILYRQDLGHLVELKRMSRLEQDMYPAINLRVTVSHFKGNFPTQLRIDNGEYDPIDPNAYYAETYIKDPNGNYVRCTKYEKSQPYHKFQSFDKELPWLPGVHPTRYNAFKPIQESSF